MVLLIYVFDFFFSLAKTDGSHTKQNLKSADVKNATVVSNSSVDNSNAIRSADVDSDVGNSNVEKKKTDHSR